MLDSHQSIFFILTLLLVLCFGVELIRSIDVESIEELQDVVLVEALLFGLSEQ